MTLRNVSTATAFAALMGLASVTAGCASPVTAAVANEVNEERPAPVVDQTAIAALDRMAAFLNTFKTFELTANTEIDEVMDDGQKLQFGATVTYKVRRPDRFFIQMTGDRKVRQLYYNGKTVTLTSPRMGMYTVFAAPPTIGAVLDLADEKYGIDVPLADLFYWGTEKISPDVVQGAKVIGYANINGIDTDHYAFQGAQVDWQIWIQRGNKPFPVKVVITSYNEDESPQYSAELAWKTPGSLPEKTFGFKPPAGAVQISIAEAVEASNESGTTP
jgi:hypothetical protein